MVAKRITLNVQRREKKKNITHQKLIRIAPEHTFGGIKTTSATKSSYIFRIIECDFSATGGEPVQSTRYQYGFKHILNLF
ncbi:hypothetical protein AKO1_005833 [Acrasis kona]|uniref:Uncharacterized protein n=1 Tax=Acrasis kona TaxID=1008807 RepID=A0AAW2YIB1_9EUKA